MNTHREWPGAGKGWLRAASGFLEGLGAAGLADLSTLSSRGLGAVMTDHASSWVRRHCISLLDFYVKTYDYPTARSRLRGAGRNTVFAPSRAMREFRALEWLREHGFAAPLPLAVGEHRRLGVLTRAVLVTEAWPGESLDRLLPALPPRAAASLLRDLRNTVNQLHQSGFRDRNLDPRNLLASRGGSGGWEIAKIDSPRFRLRRPGPATDGLARADLDRLRRGLDALSCELPG